MRPSPAGGRAGGRQRDYRKAAGYGRGGVPVFLVIDPVERARALFTEPEDDDYSVRQIVRFGEPLFIPAGGTVARFPTGNL